VLYLVALVALAIVSLSCASAWWEAAVLSLALVIFFANAIVALVDRGPRQAFAIGMVVVMAGYTGVKWFDPGVKFRHLGVPTNSLLIQLQSGIARVAYYDSRSGERLVGFVPPANSGGTAPSVPTYYQDTIPLLEHVLPVGQMWFAILFGYLGGWFAAYVYRRQHVQPRRAG
jgi:hypothetical protein